ncbi:hypothetical protein PsAD2_04616 [Pseudovibrio axinellae]|uniref:LamG-like jellyroll fold domain-containing protein n=1 Tax=Pseudovibrio axinellae TaxID=989403 RepID=A0A161UG93_9HYPH|nr:hypothetical protein [Pseudovibrio axinellae]KZL04533.1 hypothetical protein PsAD2_04616 [Pseudovibrio axinellae]SEQ74072.1 hypothetical protein SAMN05421798_10492 [Pseudovibrio axinellae]
MAMSVFTLPHADFTGQGLPTLFPFVERADLEFSYDFRARADRLECIDGDRAALVPYRNDIVAGVYEVDPSIILPASSGDGIRIELGCLLTDYECPTIPIDGSMQFSVLVVGGFSGVEFPADKISGSTPSNVNFLDFGSGGGPNSVILNDHSNGDVGARIDAAAINVGSEKSSLAQKVFMILTFDGSNWTVHNKTLGTIVTRSNAELGITEALEPLTTQSTTLAIGHYSAANTSQAKFPDMYQLAMWRRVLNDSEITAQYVLSKAAQPNLDL